MNLPVVHAETDQWALVIKPHGMPTAPLRAGEPGTLINWFLGIYPQAASVTGRKSIEHGLVHRLDTATAGLVLIAKTQDALDYFLSTQEKDGITKTYTAYCAGIPSFISERFSVQQRSIPRSISSQFRAWGPGRKEVRPVFPGERQYQEDRPLYETMILSSQNARMGTHSCTLFECSLTRGFRHQVRVHLCTLGFPILGDVLYNREFNRVPMHLYATGITFLDPESHAPKSFLLPRPDKTIQ